MKDMVELPDKKTMTVAQRILLPDVDDHTTVTITDFVGRGNLDMRRVERATELELIRILRLADADSRVLVTMDDKPVYYDKKLEGYACPKCGENGMRAVLHLALSVALYTWPNMLGTGAVYMPYIQSFYDGYHWKHATINSYGGMADCYECDGRFELTVRPSLIDPPSDALREIPSPDQESVSWELRPLVLPICRRRIVILAVLSGPGGRL